MAEGAESKSQSRRASGQTDPVDEVAIITGSASGIGRGTALAFAALNYRLALVDKNADRLAETAQMCREKSPRGHKVGAGLKVLAASRWPSSGLALAPAGNFHEWKILY